ncbi:hypothetical protein CI610_01601 [invertebrate metagenome]|uniref:Uncharacterized protein n=1 Tax=invertebrate metagenome TaxID=1711999 RepID=A0A2H9T8F3_9ZZZZ
MEKKGLDNNQVNMLADIAESAFNIPDESTEDNWFDILAADTSEELARLADENIPQLLLGPFSQQSLDVVCKVI